MQKARARFSLPNGYEPVAAIALGWAGDPNILPEELRDRELAPRTRKPLTEFVFTGRWGQTASLVTGEGQHLCHFLSHPNATYRMRNSTANK